MSKIKKFFFWFLSISVFLIIILLRPICKIRLGILDSSRIGHFLDETLNYLIYEKQKKSIDIWISVSPICNYYLYNQIKKKLFVCEKNLGLIFLRIFNLFKIISFESFIIKKFNYRSYKKWKNISKRIDLLKISLQDEKNIKDIFFKKKIKLKKNFVCINIRDSFYLKNIFPNKNWRYHDFRNSDIKCYKPAINYLLKKGYQVFRMGENNDSFFIKNKNFINLSTYDFNQDIIDFYLVKNSKFVICNNTGWETIGAYYNKDIIMADGIGMGLTHFGYPYYIIFKHIINNKNNKKLSVNNIIENNFHFKTNVDEYKKDSLRVLDNSSAEILNLIKEYLNGKFSLQNKKYKKIQDQIKIKIINSFKNSPENYEKNLYINNRKIFWNFGINFLKKNTN